MFLYLARHAWAGSFGDPGWPDDSLRELTPEGAERYARMVRTLAGRGFAPTRIATSPNTRCVQTASIIAEHMGIAEHTGARATVDELDALAPGSDADALLAWTAAQPGHDVCWVGHNPDIEVLAATMLGDGGAGVRFAKGGICAIELDEPPRAGEPFSAGRLYWHVTAKVLGL